MEYVTVLVLPFSGQSPFIDIVRVVNAIIGTLACFCLYYYLAKPKWHTWNVPRRLWWMALFLLCLTGTYGSLEARYFETMYRVPMFTVALVWAMVAALWHPENTSMRFWKR